MLREPEEKKGGRLKGLSPENLQLALTALDLHHTGKYASSEIATRLKMHSSNLYSHQKPFNEVLLIYGRLDHEGCNVSCC